MKKLIALALAIMMISLTACGGGEYAAAAKELEKITGEKVTADDVKESLEQMEDLTGEKMTPEELVEFTRSMYGLVGG